MAILNPDHLFAQAERLIETAVPGQPRQTDIRRAISTAYYGLFHFIAASAADETIGAVHRNSLRYQLAYRSIDHRALRSLCAELAKPALAPKYRGYFPSSGPAAHMQAFASGVVELQEKRHSADYDPHGRRRTSDASDAIARARSAIARFQEADASQRRMFLALLLFPPR